MVPYEGGMDLAPQARDEIEPLMKGSPAHEVWDDAALQSVHVVQPTMGWASGSTDPSTGPDLPGEDLASDNPSSAKRIQPSVMQGLPLGWCGSDLFHCLLEVLPLRSQDTGRRSTSSLFPLPTSRRRLLEHAPGLLEFEVFWCLSVCVSLNSFWGDEVWNDSEINAVQQGCIDEILKDVKRIVSIHQTVERVDWKDFFNVRTIDYKGDEVKVARWFSWGNIQPALPADVGNVPLDQVCTHGCRDYVLNFDQYLKPEDEWGEISCPRVMVKDSDWPAVCEGLLLSRVCVLIPEQEVFHTSSGPLLNGLFGVEKNEATADGVDIYRLIMNLVPLNSLCKPLAGDVDTLPSWSGMSPFYLQPNEQLLVTSEDVKCFFYVMAIPSFWTKYLAFNKLVPDAVLPESLKGQRVYLASRVLPMGFLNSVSLAQHVRRNLVKWSCADQGEVAHGDNNPEGELRKDREFSTRNPNWRVYLDNYDLLERVEASEVVALEGTQAAGVLSLRQQYEKWGVPRNVKKSVERSSLSELQGATIDGVAGVAYPRETKLVKYFNLAIDLCHRTSATQRQWQVVCGGLVYFSMFRRPLLGSLNQVWQHILSFDRLGKRVLTTPVDCKLEVLRFLGMLPLARLDFRLDMNSMVTCSDASQHGGGICASHSLTPLGGMIAKGALRGEIPEPGSDLTVFSIGLFDGIGALRVALEVLNVRVLGHVSVESSKTAKRVVEFHYPGVETVDAVQLVTEELVQQWACRYSQCSMVLIGAGPPCQGVSGLNVDRKGALRDERSCLFQEIPRIQDLVRRAFRWCPVHAIRESVASMDAKDRKVMTEAFGDQPLLCDAGSLTWCHRPRLYWLSWEVESGESVELDPSSEVCTLRLSGKQHLEEVIRAGWRKVDTTRSFPTFTTSRPRTSAGRKPAGIQQCDLHELERWHLDSFRFPPYQYKDIHCVVNGAGDMRVPDVSERELMMGFPLHYTAACCGKSERKKPHYTDTRLTLLGNSWSVPVVAWLLGQLFAWLGWIQPRSPQDILEACRPGSQHFVQGRLVRLPLNVSKAKCPDDPYNLACKLGNLVSVKGEDILLATPTSQMAKFHRLRASVPSRLWRWTTISGWKWRHKGEHINGLELRAVLTSLRWRIEKKLQIKCRMVHLTDSLVCLHTLSRGRSSSRRLRRTMARVNALVLAGNVQAVWAYERAAQRRRLGSLKELTVQPATRKRYASATEGFFTYLRNASLTLPQQKAKLDALVSDYVEFLWSTGAGRAQASDTLAGLQDLQPNLRGNLPGSWRLLKTWSINEIPARAPPLPEHVVHSMAGWAFFKGWFSFGVSLIVGFYCMLRTSEILGLRSSHLFCGRNDKQVVISLGFTKGGKRQGAAESVILGFEPAVALVKRWKDLVSPVTPLVRYPRRADRKRLAASLQEGWLVRPVCSTVPPRVWQKYLQKRSLLPRAPLPQVNSEGLKIARGRRSGSHQLYCGHCLVGDGSDEAEEARWCYVCGCVGTGSAKLCGPKKGKQCLSCLRTQWAHASDDPDNAVAFIEDVLRIIPVKDDRVLPEELVNNLLNTGLWTQLNIRAGVPLHRRTPGMGLPDRKGHRLRTL
eukprot:s627_g10.t1